MLSFLLPRITPIELESELKSDQPPKLIDVRENEEVKVSKLNGSVHIPLASLPERLKELDPEASWVVYCRSGDRSAHAVSFLRKSGFKNVRNLDGGLMAYARTVRPDMKVL